MNSLVKYFVLLFLPVFTVNGGSVNFNGTSPDGGNYQVPVKSFVEMRFKTVYKQRYDFSCGSAALASPT